MKFLLRSRSRVIHSRHEWLIPNNTTAQSSEGHIAQLNRPGKAKGKAQLQLAFEQIKFPTGQAAKISWTGH